MPSIASLNCHITSGFSGLPKFRQFVAAIGRAPVQATLRAASATACIAPTRGERKHQRPLPSVASASARFDSFSRTTAASPAPGPTRVLVRTIESYCSVIHCFDAIVGDASKRRKFSVRSAPSARRTRRAVRAKLPRFRQTALRQSAARIRALLRRSRALEFPRRRGHDAARAACRRPSRGPLQRRRVPICGTRRRLRCSRPRSATSSMRSCDSLSIISYGVMLRFALRHARQIDFDSHSAARSHFRTRTRQPCRAHILNRRRRRRCASLRGTPPAAAFP